MTRTLLAAAVFAFLGQLAAGSPALAKKRPQVTTKARTFVARWSAHMNRHGRGHGYASNERIQANVRLTLRSGGRVELVDAGERADSSLSYGAYRSDRISWSNRWTGRHRRRGKRLSLSLRLEKRRCQRVVGYRRRNETHETKTKKPCTKPATWLKLDCESTTVQAAPADDAKPGAKPTQQPIWRCTSAKDGAQTYGSRTPWVFGQKRCLESYGIRRLRYRICAQKKGP